MRSYSGKEFTRLLEQNGWKLQRVQGSHHVYIKSGSRVRISVPVHGNQALKIGLQHHLMKLASLPKED